MRIDDHSYTAQQRRTLSSLSAIYTSVATSMLVWMDMLSQEDLFNCHSKKIYETKLHKCLSEEFEPIFISPHLFSFSYFRDQTTAQSVLILRMVQTVWRNAPMAYRELTVSFLSMRIRIGNATHAIQTAPKGKHPFWLRAKSWTCFQLKG